MLKFLKRIGDKWWVVVLMIISILVNVYMDFRIPAYLSEIIRDLQEGKDVATVAVDSFWMLIVALLSGLSAVITCKLASIISAHMVSVARYQLFKRVGEFSITEMNKYNVSSLVTRTTNDLTFVGNAFNMMFRYVVYGPLLAIISMIMLLSTGIWQMTLAIFVAVVLMLVFISIIVKVVMPKYEAIQNKLDKVTLVTRENLEGLRVVRAYNAEDYQQDKFERVSHELMVTERFSNRGFGLLTPGIMFIVGALNVSIYLIGSYMIPNGAFDYAALSGVIQYAALILTGFVMLVVVVIQLPRCMVCAKRVNEVIDTEPAVKGAEVSPETSEVGTIEFKNVTFSYPGAEEPVLNDVSFKVNKGETIAFIGATGSGKTTLVNLLLRFFDTTSGEVLVDGHNVKEYRLEDLNHKFGYVPQKGYLFHDTLANNVTLGRPDATPADLDRALDISQSKEFISKIPQGVEYEISQGGKNVSGGQRQRLCIARAIIMNPEIFVFDDSFSALDYRTDKVLRGEIKKQCAGVTNVIVAQRVGTILDADQIVVLDNGKCVGIGKHKELLETCPVYKEIALSQLSKEELENGK